MQKGESYSQDISASTVTNNLLQLENVSPLFTTKDTGHCTYQLHLSDRSKRVKDARNEAQKEIEEYRKQKDDEFKKFEKEVRHAPTFDHLNTDQGRCD